MKVAFANEYIHPLNDGHRFPMQKYTLLFKRIQDENICSAKDIFPPKIGDNSFLELVHSKQYIDDCINARVDLKEWKKVGFPYSRSLIEREIIIMNGSIQAATFALSEGISLNIAGGTHHAFESHGEGFCIFNDVALSALYLNKYFNIKKILIIDLDVHQGNGTAKIFENNHDIFTFSMHGKKKLSLHKATI